MLVYNEPTWSGEPVETQSYPLEFSVTKESTEYWEADKLEQEIVDSIDTEIESEYEIVVDQEIT